MRDLQGETTIYETTKDMTGEDDNGGRYTTEKTMEDARTESTTRECETPEENTAEKRCDRCLECVYYCTFITVMLGFIQCMCLVVLIHYYYVVFYMYY